MLPSKSHCGIFFFFHIFVICILRSCEKCCQIFVRIFCYFIGSDSHCVPPVSAVTNVRILFRYCRNRREGLAQGALDWLPSNCGHRIILRITWLKSAWKARKNDISHVFFRAKSTHLPLKLGVLIFWLIMVAIKPKEMLDLSWTQSPEGDCHLLSSYLYYIMKKITFCSVFYNRWESIVELCIRLSADHQSLLEPFLESG